MKSILIKLLIFCLALVWSLQTFSQETNRKKIIGTWTFSKLEFFKSNPDSLSLINNSKGLIIIFSEDKVTVKIKTDSTTRTSGYTISPDGGTLTNNGVAAKIIKLTDEELVFKVDEEGYIQYFKKVH